MEHRQHYNSSRLRRRQTDRQTRSTMYYSLFLDPAPNRDAELPEGCVTSLTLATKWRIRWIKIAASTTLFISPRVSRARGIPELAGLNVVMRIICTSLADASNPWHQGHTGETHLKLDCELRYD